MSFMRDIEASQLSPLDQLAFDYCMLSKLRQGHHAQLEPVTPSIDFCCRSLGVPEADEVVARRLNVTTVTVKIWREIGKRANGGCRR